MLLYLNQSGMDDLIKIDNEFIWHPFTQLKDSAEQILVTSASGVYLHTSDGRKIMDAVSSWWVNLHGHAHPEIANAVAEQARKLEHVIFAGFTHEPAISLVKNLLSILPSNQRKVFFSDNGSTAVEVALKMAIQYWHNLGVRRKKIIAIDGAYHGDTFGSMSVGERGLFTNPFSGYLFGTNFLPFPSEGNEEKTVQALKEYCRAGDVCAFVFEPLVQGASGMRVYGANVLDQLINVAKQHDVICIADEVFTGFGRTGKLFASDHLKNKPDIMALSKGLTGGTLPLGVTTCSDKIVSAFVSEDVSHTFFHGHSYTANPLACAAGNASFRLLTNAECGRQIRMIERKHIQFIQTLKGHKNVKCAKSLGTILSLELATSEETSYTNQARKHIYQYFLERNILLRPLGNVIYVLPPYVITHDELDYIYQAIRSFLENEWK